MRNLTKTLVAVSLLTSTSVHSLGIGGIKLRSALNQKLNAEIALVTSGNENVGDIQVKLASPAKFDEAGVPWSYFLTKIKFTPITKADGSVGVKLSSNEALKEPYLDFLVEVTGPNGTLFREFTVLVDPPKSYISPDTAKKPDLPIVAHLAPKSEPVAIEDYEAPRQQAESRIDHEEMGNDHASGDYDSAAREYGPTQESDTIWSIANQVKPDDVSTAQMVAAIYRVNPRAFSKANVNTLLAGKILRIPAHNAILKLSRQQAAIGFKQSGHRHAGINKPKSIASEHSVKVAKPVKHLKLDSPVIEAQIPQAGEVAGTLEATEGSGQNRASVDTAADADLKLRFEKIEQQLQMMEKLLSVKDAELARLQRQSPPSDIKPDTVAPAVEPVKTEPVIEKRPVDVEPVTDVLPAAAPKVADLKPEIVEAKVTPAPVATPTAAPESALETSPMNPLADYLIPAGGIGASLLAALGLIWWRKRKVEKTIDTESMFASASQISMPDKDKAVSALTEQTSGYEVGTVGDSTFLSEFTPSEFDAFETDQTEIDPLSEADVYLAYGRYQQAEELIKQVIEASPNRNDCKLKLLEIYHTSENKTAFDQYVEVLIAEGKQADTVFWAKVTDMSGDFKLVPPVASATLSKTKVANETFVPDFKSPSDEFDFDLQSFAEMSTASEHVTKEDNNSVKPVAAVMASASSVFKDELEYPDFSNDLAASELDFELKQYETDNFSAIQMNENLVESSDMQSLDFDLSAFAPKKAAAAEVNEIEFMTEDDGNGLDFDLSAFDKDDGSAMAESVGLIDADEANSIEFDLAVFGENFQTPAAKEPQELLAGFNFDVAEETLDQQTDFDLSDELDESLRDLDFSTASLNSKKPLIEVDNTVEDSTDFDFDFDFNLAGSQLDKGFDKLDLGDVADTDSSFDKIDLANAYVDMGDVDAAKDIARDLLKGSAEQKKAGKEILEKIS